MALHSSVHEKASNQNRLPSYRYIWAVTRDLQQCGIPTSADPDEPAQPPYKLRYSQQLNTHIISKRHARAPIRLCVSVGWPEALLVAQTTSLEISCTGSIMIKIVKTNNPHLNKSIKGLTHIVNYPVDSTRWLLIAVLDLLSAPSQKRLISQPFSCQRHQHPLNAIHHTI